MLAGFTVALGVFGWSPGVTFAANETVQVWQTTADFSSALTRKTDLTFGSSSNSSAYAITVDDTKRYQQMDGFGVSLTDAASYVLTTYLTADKRTEVMNQLFGPDGIGMSMLRQPMGSCDFNRQMYSYDDTAGDTDLTSFSVAKDEEVMIPLIKQALTINPQIKIIGSPWSAPGWMKTSGSMIGGTLSGDKADTYAKYFVKYVQAYQQHGISIYAVTPQNEPGYSPNNYPGMLLSVQQQTDFIKNNLGPQLATLAQPPLIICYDHNYDGWMTPETIYADATANRYVAGAGFHHYGGYPGQMSQVETDYPSKGIWFTEGGIGDWNDTFGNLAHEMVAIPRNWAKSIIFWNAALDQSDGPALIGLNNTNQGMVTVRNDTQNSVTYNHQFYYMGHLSKFVQPGAWRIDSPNTDGNVETVAFLNPDKSIAILVYNANSSTKTVAINWRSQTFTVDVPATSLTTFVWSLTPHVKWGAKTVSARPGQLIGVPMSVTNDGTTPWTSSYQFQVWSSWNNGQTYDSRYGYLVATGNALGTADIGQSTSTAFMFTAPSTVGSYSLVLHPYINGSNAPPLATDTTVTLNVVDQSVSRLSNVSVRGIAGTGAQTLTLGFVIASPTPKQVLLRAIGPTLSVLGVPNVLPDPHLKLYDAHSVLQSENEDWGGDSTLSQQFDRLGAFGLPTNSKDAAMYLPIAEGGHTGQVTTTGTAGGVALVEAYDGDSGSSPGRFMNVSARNQVGTDANALIIGFVIAGQSPKTVLIRGVGPTLTVLGVPGVLANPELTLYDHNSQPILTNDDWGGSAAMSAEFDHLGAFGLPADSKDAAMLVTLDPGLYTAKVSGVGNTTGVALVEVYDGD